MPARSSSFLRDPRVGLAVAVVIVLVLVVVVLVVQANGARGAGPPPATPEPAVLRLAGSGTVGERLAPELAEAFLQARRATGIRTEIVENQVTVIGTLPGAAAPTRLEINPKNTDAAFTALADASADIGMASRRVSPEERDRLADRGDLFSRDSEHVLALDAVTVVVNHDRILDSLTLDQLRAIYTCEITDWSQLGQPAGRIRALAFPDGSGTVATVRTLALGGAEICPGVERLPSDSGEALAREVDRDVAAIGVVGLPFVGENRALALSADGTRPLEPSALNISTESYQLTRRLYLYLPTRPVQNRLATEFVEFALSEDGQRIVDATGFVSPLFPPKQAPPKACPADLPAYCDAVQAAERVPFDVRFAPGTAEVDNRAFRNLNLLGEVLKEPQHAGQRVLLIGFADNAGSEPENDTLSAARADAGLRELAARGIPADVRSFGEALPVASNDTPEGREQNRRVEVWLR